MLTNGDHKDALLEALVVGAGPAGMFAALSLAAAGSESVLLIDAGPDVDGRKQPPRARPGRSAARTAYESGVGGAGLFSDGKLCLSLDVGGHLETSLTADERGELLADIERVLFSLVDGGFIDRRSDDIDGATAEATKAGLDFKYYPVAHVGTDRCRDVILRLRSLIELAGVSIESEAELLDLSLARSGEKVAMVRTHQGVERIRAKNVVLAMGKIGAPREAEICRRLGVDLIDQPLYAGLRFEAAAEAVAPLFALSKDPKYSLPLPDGSKIKTHCASEHGEVLALSYAGLPLAGGHNYSNVETGRSGFSVLWNGMETGPDSYETALEIMGRASRFSGHELMVQRFSDYLARRPSSAADMAAIELSCPEAVAGDVREILPPRYFDHMERFLERLQLIAPELASGDAVLYGPAIEWWMKRIAVTSREMATSIPGLAVCGDGSGWSQGIIHAAATGLLAAKGIHGRAIGVSGWLSEPALVA